MKKLLLKWLQKVTPHLFTLATALAVMHENPMFIIFFICIWISTLAEL